MIIKYLIIILASLGTLLLVLYLLWVIIPSLSGLPWIPTRPQRIRRALKLAQLSPGEIFYDMGSGDGRALIIAAREFGAHAIGIEISPIHCIYAWVNVILHGVYNQVEIKWASFYKVDMSNANVIFAYMTPKQTLLLQPRLESHLHPGSRVVTVSCEIAGWRPIVFNREDLLYLYQIPGSFQ